MAITRVHGGKALEQQVIRLQKEGWHVANIASIAKVNADGLVTGVKKGTCTVYAYAQNGVCAKIAVTVS